MKWKFIVLAFAFLIFLWGCSESQNPVVPEISYSVVGHSSAIYGNLLVVSDLKSLKVIDLTKKKVVKTIPIPSNYGALGFDIYADTIIWSDLRNEKSDLSDLSSLERANADIFVYNLRTDEMKQVTRDVYAQQNPKIWRNYLVWEDNRNDKKMDDREEWDIYLYNLDTGEEKLVSTARGIHTSPNIDDYKIVWEDGRNFKGEPWLRGGANVPENNTDIYLYDIRTGREAPVAIGPLQEAMPYIYKNYIVWEDRNNGTNNADIVFFDLKNKKKRHITKDRYSQFSPRLYGDYIVWMDERRGISSNDVYVNGKAPNPDIFMYDLKTNTEKLMTGDEVQMLPRISSEWLAFTLSRQVDPKVQVIRYAKEDTVKNLDEAKAIGKVLEIYPYFPDKPGKIQGLIPIGGKPPGKNIPAQLETRVEKEDTDVYIITMTQTWNAKDLRGTKEVKKPLLTHYWKFEITPTGVDRLEEGGDYFPNVR